MYSKNHFHVGKLRTIQTNSRLSLFCDERKCQIFEKHDTNTCIKHRVFKNTIQIHVLNTESLKTRYKYMY